MHAVYGRRRSLVELPRQIFNSEERPAAYLAVIGYSIRHHLSEHAVTAFFQQIAGKPEQIIYVNEPQLFNRERKVTVQFIPEAVRLHPEPRIFFNENPIIRHIGSNLG